MILDKILWTYYNFWGPPYQTFMQLDDVRLFYLKQNADYIGTLKI